MTLQEFYKAIDGNYEEAINRMLKEERIKKYLGRFEETINFADLDDGMSKKDYDAIFRFLHNLKGVALNLELGVLARHSSDLCEMVRHGDPGIDITSLVEEVKNDFKFVTGLIKEIDE